MSTASRAQAVFLRALAEHLDRWDLAPVDISSNHAGGWVLQVWGGGDASGGLTGWARSFSAAELRVRPLTRQVNVDFSGTVGDYPVTVWGCVDPLREALGLLTELDATITVAELAHFAEHGTVPPADAGGAV